MKSAEAFLRHPTNSITPSPPNEDWSEKIVGWSPFCGCARFPCARRSGTARHHPLGYGLLLRGDRSPRPSLAAGQTSRRRRRARPARCLDDLQLRSAQIRRAFSDANLHGSAALPESDRIADAVRCLPAAGRCGPWNFSPVPIFYLTDFSLLSFYHFEPASPSASSPFARVICCRVSGNTD